MGARSVSLRRSLSEIRAVCANERPSGSVRGVCGNWYPYRDWLKQEPGRSVAELCKPWSGEAMLADLARQKVRNVQIMEELIERVHPELLARERGLKSTLGVPLVEAGG